MIRKVYLDFLQEKLSRKQFRWLIKRGLQYGLLHASHLAGRPFCGPILGTLITNYSCNFNCVMCDMKLRDRELRSQGHTEFDTNRMKDVLADFADLGVSGVGFTGGEPLLRKDIFELLAYTKELGMISHLNTNGSLVTERAVENIISAGVDSVNISLDGARPESHDIIRGTAGSFQKAVTAIQRIAAARGAKGGTPRLKTVTVLQESNVDEAFEIIKLAGELSVDCVEFIPRQPFTIDSDRAQKENEEFIAKMDRVADFLLKNRNEIVQIENSPTQIRGIKYWLKEHTSPFKCYATYNSITVDCFGEIYPCLPMANWRQSVGNMRETSLRDFWYSPGYKLTRRKIATCRKCYLNCHTELNLLFDPFHFHSKPARRLH